MDLSFSESSIYNWALALFTETFVSGGKEENRFCSNASILKYSPVGGTITIGTHQGIINSSWGCNADVGKFNLDSA